MVEVNARYAVESRHIAEHGKYWVAFAWFEWGPDARRFLEYMGWGDDPDFRVVRL